MIDQAKLQDVLKHYKQDFVSFKWNDKDYKRWNEEKFKWEAVQWFQEHWNVNAEDFQKMLKESLKKASTLLDTAGTFSKAMIDKFAQAAPEEVRAAFIALYDESKDVYERIHAFKQQAEVMLKKYRKTAKNHFQTESAITTYLWLRYPDKYYIYKYGISQKVATALGADYSFKMGAYADNIRNFLKMYDEISVVLKENIELVKLFKENRTDSCYPDPELKTLTVDLGFYIANFYEDRMAKEIEPIKEVTPSQNNIPSNISDVTDPLEMTVNTWLLNWNPSNPTFQWEEQQDYHGYYSTAQKVKSGGTVLFNWTCLSQQVKQGDRIFMIKLGTQPRGIFATGYAVNDSQTETFTDNNNEIVTLRSVDICVTGFLDYHTDELIAQDMLKQKFPDQQWSPQGSGISIKPNAARWLIDHWNDYIKQTGAHGEPTIDEPAAVEPYTKDDFLSEVYMTEERYNALAGVLLNKQNIILQGAPGVGKTFAARRLAWSVMGEKDDSRIEFVQFHQKYSYEDFMMGYKPSGDGFELKYGIFYRFCQKAANQPDKQFFFIIDEINRGNMSKIFGELLMLIEKDYRGTKATLAYNGMPFSVPKNLYIIGMMNTADRSLAMIDYALRRRFSFFDVEPGFDSQGFIAYQNSLNNDTLNELIAKVKDLNNEIALDKSLGKGFCIGHSYFCGRKDCTEDWLRAVVDYDILPMLREYWFDEANKIQIWENKLLGVFQS